MLGKTHWSRWSGLNRRPTVYETVALPLSYTGDARSANEPVKYGHHAGAASGKFKRDAFYAANGLVPLGTIIFRAQTAGNRLATDNGTYVQGSIGRLKRHGVDAMTAGGLPRSGQVRDPVQKPAWGSTPPMNRDVCRAYGTGAIHPKCSRRLGFARFRTSLFDLSQLGVNIARSACS